MTNRTFQPFEKAVSYASNVLSAIGLGMLMIMMLLGAADVIGRYIFNRPVTGTLEISEILLAGIVFFGWAYTQAVKAHVTVTLVTSRFSRRTQAVLGFATSSLTLVLFSLIIWKGVVIGMVYWEANRNIDVINVPIAPFQFFVPFGAIFLCLVLIIQMVEYITEIRRAD